MTSSMSLKETPVEDFLLRFNFDKGPKPPPDSSKPTDASLLLCAVLNSVRSWYTKWQKNMDIIAILKSNNSTATKQFMKQSKEWTVIWGYKDCRHLRVD